MTRARDAVAQAGYAAAFIALAPVVITAGLGIAVWIAWQNRKDRRS